MRTRIQTLCTLATRWAKLALPLIALAGASAGAQDLDPIEGTSLLGKPLRRPALDPRVKQDFEAKLAQARRAFEHTPSDPDSIIWLGRRTAYLGRFGEAIEIWTKGIERFANDARFYRHRGHRYLTIRKIDLAIRDLERAAELERGKPDAIEPDGLPNARNIPTSTLQSNIRYHLGLAYYLKGDFDRAARWFGEDAARHVNDDMLVASTHWLYMSLRRGGKDAEAAKALDPIKPTMNVIENQSYHRLDLLYQGLLPIDSVWVVAKGGATPEDAAVGYGVANYHLYNGRTDQALTIFRRICDGAGWPSFGFLASEAELARKR